MILHSQLLIDLNDKHSNSLPTWTIYYSEAAQVWYNTYTGLLTEMRNIYSVQITSTASGETHNYISPTATHRLALQIL